VVPNIFQLLSGAKAPLIQEKLLQIWNLALSQANRTQLGPLSCAGRQQRPPSAQQSQGKRSTLQGCAAPRGVQELRCSWCIFNLTTYNIFCCQWIWWGLIPSGQGVFV
jgi:hypothetical protein